MKVRSSCWNIYRDTQLLNIARGFSCWLPAGRKFHKVFWNIYHKCLIFYLDGPTNWTRFGSHFNKNNKIYIYIYGRPQSIFPSCKNSNWSYWTFSPSSSWIVGCLGPLELHPGDPAEKTTACVQFQWSNLQSLSPWIPSFEPQPSWGWFVDGSSPPHSTDVQQTGVSW